MSDPKTYDTFVESEKNHNQLEDLMNVGLEQEAEKEGGEEEH